MDISTMAKINREDAILLIGRLKSESIPVRASFVAIPGGLDFSMRGRVLSDENGRIVVSNRWQPRPPNESNDMNERPAFISELAFEIDEKCSFEYTEPKDYPPELRRTIDKLSRAFSEATGETLPADWPGYASGMNILILDRGRISLLELTGSSTPSSSNL